MRAAITGSTLMVSVLLIILIHCTIIGNNARESEISSGLNNSMDYAYDKMLDMYSEEDFAQNITDESVIMAELMEYFCFYLQYRLGSNGEVKVQLLYTDLDTGTFQVRATEYFTYPFLQRTGTCMFEKTYSLY